MSLSREEILARADLKRVTVKVPEWGGEVVVQEMTALKRLQFEQSLADDDPKLRLKLIVYSTVDDSGQPLFSMEDLEALQDKNFKAIKRISDAALRLSRLGQAEVDAAAENFTGSPSGG